MMEAKDLLEWVLRVQRLIDKLGPFERAEVLHVATAYVQVEIARLKRPQPVRDE